MVGFTGFLPIVAIVIYTLVPKQRGVVGTDANVEFAAASDLAPTGELADTFSFFSNATQLQRDEKEREIIGKIVQWRLPVYNVSERDGFYVIQTKSRPGLVAAFCYVRAVEAIKSYVLSLRENDLVTCKGTIAGSSMRTIQLRPAVLQ